MKEKIRERLIKLSRYEWVQWLCLVIAFAVVVVAIALLTKNSFATTIMAVLLVLVLVFFNILRAISKVTPQTLENNKLSIIIFSDSGFWYLPVISVYYWIVSYLEVENLFKELIIISILAIVAVICTNKLADFFRNKLKE